MIIIPAIDLKDGRCVRLKQGRENEVKTYSEDPISMARHWVDEGAQRLHVVDLDGAFRGQPVHHAMIAGIAAAIDIPIEVGGGLRTDDDIRHLLTAGVSQAIIGTRALTDAAALQPLAEAFGPGLAVGIDARDGLVQVKGWVEATAMKAVELAQKADEMGVDTIIYTDIATDGMMSGTNATAVGEICAAVNCNVVASGGITTADDIRVLTELKQSNLIGAIVGKALYEETVTLKELIETAA